MLVNNLIPKATFVLLFSTSLAVSTIVNAEAYSPFPGKLSAQLVSVNSTSSIDVSAETWPGFSRVFSISLSGIDVPTSSSDAILCERELAKEALVFVEEYLSKAEKIEINNMTMQTSSDQNVQADLQTEKGSLSQALKTRGYARSNEIEHDEPWC